MLHSLAYLRVVANLYWQDDSRDLIKVQILPTVRLPLGIKTFSEPTPGNLRLESTARRSYLGRTPAQS